MRYADGMAGHDVVFAVDVSLEDVVHAVAIVVVDVHGDEHRPAGAFVRE